MTRFRLNQFVRPMARDGTALLRAAVVLMLAVFSGCAAITNPAAQGIPAMFVEPELLAEPKDEMVPMPLSYLRRKPADVYRLAAGDMLGIYIAGVLGELGEPPPVHVLEEGAQVPSLGYPVPVRENGTLSLPLIKPISVDGMTLAEAEQAIIRAYTTGDAPVIKVGRERIIVSLIQPRQTRVLVLRQDSPAGGLPIRRPGTVRASRFFRGGIEGVVRPTTSGTGQVVYLPADQNDVVTALTLTGGLPGLDAANAIVIQRGQLGDGPQPDSKPTVSGDAVVFPDLPAAPNADTEIIRIPLRITPGQPLPFVPDDVVLRDGDIVHIEARDTEVFYTGGLLPSGEFPIPRDYDLDVIEAVSQVGGPLINGGINSNNLSGAIVAPGIGNPSPRLLTVLRQTPGGGRVPIVVDLFRALQDPNENLLVKPGDVLILQETKHQAVARYFSQIFNFTGFSEVFRSGSATGVVSVSAP